MTINSHFQKYERITSENKYCQMHVHACIEKTVFCLIDFLNDQITYTLKISCSSLPPTDYGSQACYVFLSLRIFCLYSKVCLYKLTRVGTKRVLQCRDFCVMAQ
jgi:hypothetical protein